LEDSLKVESKMVTLLVTGFGPFGEWSENPTEKAVRGLEALGNAEVATYVFETSYAAVQRDLPRLFEELQPQYVLALGLAGNAETIRLEERAQNRSLSGVADVTGVTHEGEIVPGAPEYLPSTLPLERMEELLLSKGYAVSRSLDAGGYLCNFAFYLVQSLAVSFGISMSGFVHIPSAERYYRVQGDRFDEFDAVQLMVEGVRG
jgi:pyroglutamyl-peptidase